MICNTMRTAVSVNTGEKVRPSKKLAASSKLRYNDTCPLFSSPLGSNSIDHLRPPNVKELLRLRAAVNVEKLLIYCMHTRQ
jgi:hypothetical protein